MKSIVSLREGVAGGPRVGFSFCCPKGQRSENNQMRGIRDKLQAYPVGICASPQRDRGSSHPGQDAADANAREVVWSGAADNATLKRP